MEQKRKFFTFSFKRMPDIQKVTKKNERKENNESLSILHSSTKSKVEKKYFNSDKIKVFTDGCITETDLNHLINNKVYMSNFITYCLVEEKVNSLLLWIGTQKIGFYNGKLKNKWIRDIYSRFISSSMIYHNSIDDIVKETLRAVANGKEVEDSEFEECLFKLKLDLEDDVITLMKKFYMALELSLIEIFGEDLENPLDAVVKIFKSYFQKIGKSYVKSSSPKVKNEKDYEAISYIIYHYLLFIDVPYKDILDLMKSSPEPFFGYKSIIKLHSETESAFKNSKIMVLNGYIYPELKEQFFNQWRYKSQEKTYKLRTSFCVNKFSNSKVAANSLKSLLSTPPNSTASTKQPIDSVSDITKNTLKYTSVSQSFEVGNDDQAPSGGQLLPPKKRNFSLLKSKKQSDTPGEMDNYLTGMDVVNSYAGVDLTVDVYGSFALKYPEEAEKLSRDDFKVQEVIYEFIKTEKSYVRHLVILEKIFHDKMKCLNTVPPKIINCVFCNVGNILNIHVLFLKNLVRIPGPVIDAYKFIRVVKKMFLYSRYDMLSIYYGENCAIQKDSITSLNEELRKNSSLKFLLHRIEKLPFMKRLSFEDIHCCTYQRISRYPSLMESLKKSISGTRIVIILDKCIQNTKSFLNFVDSSIEEFERYKKYIVYISTINWKIPDSLLNEAAHQAKLNTLINFDVESQTLHTSIEVEFELKDRSKEVIGIILLLSKYALLLQKDDDKYSLLLPQSSKKDPFTPLLFLQNIIVRDDATNKSALFIVYMDSNGSQILRIILKDENTKIQTLEILRNNINRAKQAVNVHSTIDVQSLYGLLSNSDSSEKDYFSSVSHLPKYFSLRHGSVSVNSKLVNLVDSRYTTKNNTMVSDSCINSKNETNDTSQIKSRRLKNLNESIKNNGSGSTGTDDSANICLHSRYSSVSRKLSHKKNRFSSNFNNSIKTKILSLSKSMSDMDSKMSDSDMASEPK